MTLPYRVADVTWPHRVADVTLAHRVADVTLAHRVADVTLAHRVADVTWPPLPLLYETMTHMTAAIHWLETCFFEEWPFIIFIIIYLHEHRCIARLVRTWPPHAQVALFLVSNSFPTA